MRKKFVYYVVVPFVVVFALLYFFLDSWVESGLEYAGEKIVGAKVEIDGLRLTLSPIGVEFKRLQVTDPSDGWSNLFETGKVRFALNFGQLLRNKYIIETMEVNDLVLGTKRTSDGSIPHPPAVAASGAAASGPLIADAQKPGESKTPMFDIAAIRRSLNIDSLINPNNLATVREADSLKRKIQEADREWQTTTKAFDESKARLADVETRLKAININNIKDIPAATNALNTVKEASATVDDVSKTFQARKSVLTGQFDQFAKSIRNLDDLATSDYQNVVKLARLPDLSMKGIGELVLGKDVVRQAYTYLGYVDFVHRNMPSSSSAPPIETPRRMEGQVIHFPAERAYPKFWIKKMLLSGGTDKKRLPDYFYAKGQILNITNDQHLTGVPLSADLTATKGGTTSLDLSAVIDRRGPVGVDDYKAHLTGLKVARMSLGRSDFLPSQISGATAEAQIAVHVPGNELESSTRADFRGLTISFDAPPKNTVERIVHDVLASVKDFFVNLRVWKNREKFDMAFSTDLDSQLSSQTQRVLGEELGKIQKEIRGKVDAAIAAKRREVENLYNQKRDEVLGRVKSVESEVTNKLSMVDTRKKELENKINAEKKKQEDAVKKKAGDALKGLFKK